ncbi:MAG TPA: alternative ribosome rescue aminoacyl-tRNA hydrolase ArfB [Chryseosolibacter sp.]
MSQRPLNSTVLASELDFTTSRSSGPGGQNVNKVNTKVTLKFNVAESKILTQDEKDVLLHKLRSRLTTEGVLLLTSQDKRSQLDNKEAVLEKLNVLLKKAFEKKKPRKATKPSKAAVRKRIQSKKEHSEKKKWRQKPI